MSETKKIVLYRLLAILLLLVPFGICIWFIVWYAQNNPAQFGIHLFTTALMIFFILLQIVLLAKNIKKPLAIYDIAFNENKTVNMTAVVVIIVGCVIGLALSITMGILCFMKTEPTDKGVVMLLFNIFIFMFFDCGIFLLFVPMFKEKKFDVRDLLK